MRLIDADELKAVYIPSEIEGFEKMMVPVEVVLQNIDDMPTVDAVPVVRCKHCKHYEYPENRVPEERVWWCYCWNEGTGKDDYCSYGERKDGDG